MPDSFGLLRATLSPFHVRAAYEQGNRATIEAHVVALDPGGRIPDVKFVLSAMDRTDVTIQRIRDIRQTMLGAVWDSYLWGYP